MVLTLTTLAIIGNLPISYVSVARNWLINPLTVIYSAFGPANAEGTWEDSTKQLFEDEGEEDRLNIGPTVTDDGIIAFGVSRTAFSSHNS